MSAETTRSLEGRGAVVTGGGRGIGAEVARRLAREGCAVVVAARSLDQLEAVAAEIEGQGGRAWAVRCDVADAESVRSLAGEAVDRLAAHDLAVDILVNDAGVAHSAPIRSLTLEDWNRVLAVNATGTFLCTRAFMGEMMERGWGRIVNVASVAGVKGARYIGAYAASKHAVVGFTRCAAAEGASRGVTVNAVCPSYVETEMTRESIERIVAKTGISAEEALGAIVRTNPQGRLITAGEVAYTVLALCHEESASINGETIVIDGGGGLA